MKKIADIAYDMNQKVRGEFVVDGTDYVLPMTVICGKKPGKTVLITAGVHSCEYVGIEAVIELEKEIQPEDINGTLILVPIVNISGVEHRLPTLVPEDGKNLNRVFPGSPDGTASERLAWFFTDKIFPHIDFYMDIHSGGIYEDLDHYVYYVGNCDPAVSEAAKEAAQCCNVPFMVKSGSTTGCYNYAGVMGIPAILLERGGNGRWSYEEVEQDKADIKNMLRQLDIFDESPIDFKQNPFLLERPLYLTVSHSGLWYTNLKAGDEVKLGQELGYITDYRGNILECVHAGHDGRILYLTKTLYADKGTEVVCYATLCDGTECKENDHDHNHEHCHCHHVSSHHD